MESGSKNQPLILLLHGFPDCWLTWRHQIPVLAQHFRVVAIDLKGFGDSDKPMWRRQYRADLILEELNQLIHALGVSSCTVIGHDLGALLGWYLVHYNPHIVDRFVAVSCPHPNIYWKTLPSRSTFNGRWVTFTQLPYLPELDALKEDLSIINRCHKHLEQKYMEAYLEAYKYTFSRKEDWTGPLNYYRNLPFKRIKEKSPQTKVSTLLITGGCDKFVQLEGVVKSTDYCEKSSVKIIDDTGHFPHQEDPENFNRILLKYLKVKTDVERRYERSASRGLMDSLFGAVSGWNSVLMDSVHKRTNGVVGNIPSLGLALSNASSKND